MIFPNLDAMVPDHPASVNEYTSVKEEIDSDSADDCGEQTNSASPLGDFKTFPSSDLFQKKVRAWQHPVIVIGEYHNSHY